MAKKSTEELLQEIEKAGKITESQMKLILKRKNAVGKINIIG